MFVIVNVFYFFYFYYIKYLNLPCSCFFTLIYLFPLSPTLFAVSSNPEKKEDKVVSHFLLLYSLYKIVHVLPKLLNCQHDSVYDLIVF